MMMFYVENDLGSDEYVGKCEQFPSFSYIAPTFEEALKGIEQLVQDIQEDKACKA